MTQQTSVEWLNDKIIEIDCEFESTLIGRETYWSKRKEILEQAKEMEKQQKSDEYWKGWKAYSESL